MAYAKPMKKDPRVAIYVRVSTLHQIDKDSLPMQKKDLLAYAKLILGTEDCVIFEDAGYSGKNTDRPQFQKMMSQIRAGGFTHLLVWKIDRISRNLLDFASVYKELKDLGVVFVSKNEQFDTSTAMGEAMLKIILVFAELERNMTSERVTAAMISRASNGQWNGGRIPFGYDYDPDSGFSFNAAEKDTVLLMHDLYEEHRSLINVARALNSKKLFTRYGNQWSETTVSIILRSMFYCGDYQYNRLKDGNRQKEKDPSEWVTVNDHHPAMIDRAQKERILAILDSQAEQYKLHRRKRATKHVHVFGGLVYCNHCKKLMSCSPGSITRDGYHYSKYSCPTHRRSPESCPCATISDPIVGEFVLNYILNLLNAQRDFTDISSPEMLQKYLLTGDTFSRITAIEKSGLDDLYTVLASGTVRGRIYGRDTKVRPNKEKRENSELAHLRKEKQKLERALDRLTSLYLYSDNAMSNKEYMVQKMKLADSIEGIDMQIGFIARGDRQSSMDDSEFIRCASEFIITQKLTDRKYVNYKRLAMSVDPEVLRSFVWSIIDNISVMDGDIQSIVFRNGLSHAFVYQK